MGEALPVLPPEPGTIPMPDHGIPGNAEPYLDYEDTDVAEDDAHEDYPDIDEPDELDGEVGLPEGFGVNDGLDEPLSDEGD